MSDAPKKLTHQLIINQQNSPNNATSKQQQQQIAPTATLINNNQYISNNINNSNPVIYQHTTHNPYHQQQIIQMRKAAAAAMASSAVSSSAAATLAGLASHSSTELDGVSTSTNLTSHHLNNNSSVTTTGATMNSSVAPQSGGQVVGSSSSSSNNKSPNQTMMSTTTTTTPSSPTTSTTNNSTSEGYSLATAIAATSSERGVISDDLSSSSYQPNYNHKIVPIISQSQSKTQQQYLQQQQQQQQQQRQIVRRLRPQSSGGPGEIETLVIEGANSDDEANKLYAAVNKQQNVHSNRRSLMEPIKLSQGPVLSPSSNGGTLRATINQQINNSAQSQTGNNTNGNNNNISNNNQHHHHHHHHHHRHQHEIALLKDLMQLGVKRERAEKALAATAYASSMDAVGWLMSHSRDPLIATPNGDAVLSTRDFMLVLCPVGRLASQISAFFQQSRAKCGPNDAHFTNILPYMKLSPFFKIADSQVPNLHRAFDLVFKQLGNLATLFDHLNMLKNSSSTPGGSGTGSTNGLKMSRALNKSSSYNEINIDLHVSSQMVLLYPDIDSENLIKEAVALFNKAVQKHTNTEIIPYSKQLHLTLAYNFEPDHKRSLEDLAIQNINYRAAAEWEIRLYSRDSRADSRLTYKVIAGHKSKAENELNLKLNDYVFGSNSSKENLMKGVSHSTGESGYFSPKNVERSVESDTWRLHKSQQIVQPLQNGGAMTQTSTTNGMTVPHSPKTNVPTHAQLHQMSMSSMTQSQQQQQQQQMPNRTTLSYMEKTPSAQQSAMVPVSGSGKNAMLLNGVHNQMFSENPTMQKRFQSNPHRSLQVPGALKFFFVRHGERVDLAFGPQWIEQSFDRSGKYRRTNLNMPLDLPQRPSKRDFLGDSPLTEVGQFQARLTGDALGNEGYKIHYCYVSPALRCIQTAHQILLAQGLEKVVKIRIEPSIFEFLGWYDKGLPTFVNLEALLQFGYNIETSYKPLLPIDRLQPDENYTDYYQRSFNVTKYLTNLHQSEGGNVLVVGHAGTLEVCTRQMCGLPVRSYTEFNSTIRKVPYLGLCLLERDPSTNLFEIQPAVIPSLGHTANFNFDPNSLKV